MSEKEKILCDKNNAHYVVATAIIVNSERKFLIAKRAGWEKHSPNKWTVPGGKLERKDYESRKCDTEGGKQWYNVIEDLVKREVMEEVGLDVGKTGYVCSLVYMRDDGIPVVCISLYSKYIGGEVKLCDALTDYKWVTLEEAKGYDLIDGIYDELVILDKFLTEGKEMKWGKKNV